MTLLEFMKMVREMRDAQAAYFKGRTYEAQTLAMKLEAHVDRAIAEHEGGQKKLFGDAEPPRKDGLSW